MKKFFLPFLLGSLLLSGCRAPEESLSIWIASDLHYLDASLETDTGAYQTKNLTSDGRIQENDEMYLSIFLNEIQKKKPKVLILSGDLTFNGEKVSHLSLQKKLKQIEETTQVLVIPGNHDLLNPHAYDYSTPDQIKEVESITYEEFRTIYHDFGYAQAKECDSSSLSYVYEATPKVWMLMLDSSRSYRNDGVFMYNEGDFKKQTLSWIESILQKAKEQNAMVIPVSHHNLNCHNPMFSTGYQIINEYALKLLYEKYGVPVHFSGHMHIQHIEKSPVVYDICTSSLLDYGNRYGKITLKGNQLHYTSQALPLKEEVKKESFYFIEKRMNAWYNTNTWRDL